MPFVKLDTRILDSTLWVEREQREIFITALLMAEPYVLTNETEQLEVRQIKPTGFIVPPGEYGLVPAAGTGIIRRAMMDQEAGLKALEGLGSPDEGSRSGTHEGRRLVRVDGGYLVLNFMTYRDRDHTAAARQQRYRDKQNQLKESRRNVTLQSQPITPTSHTEAEAEAEAEATTEEKKERERTARATRLPTPFSLPKEWAEFADKTRPDLDHVKVAEKFADHWKAKPGRAGTKLDWFATWRNWVREERAPAVGSMTFKERDAANAAARVSEMTGGLVSAKPIAITRRNDALQEVFDAAKLLG